MSANSNQEKKSDIGIYLYEEQEDPAQEDSMVWINISIDMTQIEEEQIQEGINSLFHWAPLENLTRIPTKNRYSYIPKGTELLGISLVDGECTIYVSKEITQYGGTYWETKLVDQLLSTIFTFPTVQKITLFIEEYEIYLPEGTKLQQYQRSQWEERRRAERWNDYTKESMMSYEMCK